MVSAPAPSRGGAPDAGPAATVSEGSAAAGSRAVATSNDVSTPEGASLIDAASSQQPIDLISNAGIVRWAALVEAEDLEHHLAVQSPARSTRSPHGPRWWSGARPHRDDDLGQDLGLYSARLCDGEGHGCGS